MSSFKWIPRTDAHRTLHVSHSRKVQRLPRNVGSFLRILRVNSADLANKESLNSASGPRAAVSGDAESRLSLWTNLMV